MAAEKVLVIDEVPASREIALAALRGAGYETFSSAGSAEGMAQMGATACDLIVVGTADPTVSGLALVAQIKERYPAVSIIIVSADERLDSAIRAMSGGAFDYILAPYPVPRLLESVERAAAQTVANRVQLSHRQSLEQQVEARTHMLRQAVTELERSYDITLEALGDALDLKDAETEGHSKRVTAYTIALARAMGVKGTELRVMARGAFLHDIGKMAIPDAILLKPGKLNDEERSVMKEHSLRGYLIVRKIPYLKDAAEIVYSHQEYFDGSGYPRGLRGSEIPLGARIFAIADTLDAITSDRPYRQGKSFAHACGEIQRCRGTQFDPVAVDAFVKLPSQIWEDLRVEILQRGRSSTGFPPTEGADPERS